MKRSNVKNPRQGQKMSPYWLWFADKGKFEFQRKMGQTFVQTDARHKEIVTSMWNEAKANESYYRELVKRCEQENTDEKIAERRKLASERFRMQLANDPDGHAERVRQHEAEMAANYPAVPRRFVKAQHLFTKLHETSLQSVCVKKCREFQSKISLMYMCHEDNPQAFATAVRDLPFMYVDANLHASTDNLGSVAEFSLVSFSLQYGIREVHSFIVEYHREHLYTDIMRDKEYDQLMQNGKDTGIPRHQTDNLASCLERPDVVPDEYEMISHYAAKDELRYYAKERDECARELILVPKKKMNDVLQMFATLLPEDFPDLEQRTYPIEIIIDEIAKFEQCKGLRCRGPQPQFVMHPEVPCSFHERHPLRHLKCTRASAVFNVRDFLVCMAQQNIVDYGHYFKDAHLRIFDSMESGRDDVPQDLNPRRFLPTTTRELDHHQSVSIDEIDRNIVQREAAKMEIEPHGAGGVFAPRPVGGDPYADTDDEGGRLSEESDRAEQGEAGQGGGPQARPASESSASLQLESGDEGPQLSVTSDERSSNGATTVIQPGRRRRARTPDVEDGSRVGTRVPTNRDEEANSIATELSFHDLNEIDDRHRNPVVYIQMPHTKAAADTPGLYRFVDQPHSAQSTDWGNPTNNGGFGGRWTDNSANQQTSWGQQGRRSPPPPQQNNRGGSGAFRQRNSGDWEDQTRRRVGPGLGDSRGHEINPVRGFARDDVEPASYRRGRDDQRGRGYGQQDQRSEYGNRDSRGERRGYDGFGSDSRQQHYNDDNGGSFEPRSRNENRMAWDRNGSPPRQQSRRSPVRGPSPARSRSPDWRNSNARDARSSMAGNNGYRDDSRGRNDRDSRMMDRTNNWSRDERDSRRVDRPEAGSRNDRDARMANRTTSRNQRRSRSPPEERHHDADNFNRGGSNYNSRGGGNGGGGWREEGRPSSRQRFDEPRRDQDRQADRFGQHRWEGDNDRSRSRTDNRSQGQGRDAAPPTRALFNESNDEKSGCKNFDDEWSERDRQPAGPPSGLGSGDAGRRMAPLLRDSHPAPLPLPQRPRDRPRTPILFDERALKADGMSVSTMQWLDESEFYDWTPGPSRPTISTKFCPLLWAYAMESGGDPLERNEAVTYQEQVNNMRRKKNLKNADLSARVPLQVQYRNGFVIYI